MLVFIPKGSTQLRVWEWREKRKKKRIAPRSPGQVTNTQHIPEIPDELAQTQNFLKTTTRTQKRCMKSEPACSGTAQEFRNPKIS